MAEEKYIKNKDLEKKMISILIRFKLLMGYPIGDNK